MSPDTPDPHRPVDRTDEPGRAAPAAGPVPAPSGTGSPSSAAPGGGAGGDPRPAGPADVEPAPVGTWPPAYAGRPAEPGERTRPAPALAVATVLALTALGAPLGLLWAALAPETPVLKTAQGAVYAQPQPEQPIAADGWFSLLGLGFGVLAAVGLWVLLRRRRGPGGLFVVTLGGLGAALVAWQAGRRIGLSDFERLLASAPEGTAFAKPVDLRAGGVEWLLGVLPLPFGNVLLPAFAAAVTYTLLAGWSRWSSLRPEPEPDWTGGPGALSWGPGAMPAPTAAPEPPAPDAAEPPRG
ncbi:DUF2567 domain-containing protein [Micromonospora psammae]|uniref:DUF2567 domain-containing protein n=1 Tax=Micromonospora sp. CPCC 205556 TaxID=3122398 RepID=UPI002FF42E47